MNVDVITHIYNVTTVIAYRTTGLYLKKNMISRHISLGMTREGTKI